MCKPGGSVIITTPNKTNAIRIIGMIFRSSISSKSNFKQEGGHISVKGLNEWLRIVRKGGFIVEDIKRGALIYGGPRYNCHPVLFAFVLIVDCILEFLPLGKHFSESVTLKLRKPNDEDNKLRAFYAPKT
ncbi:MAG: hypothetical protein QMD71_00775 [bacterium]|nr:hypothetical protein [bacterium]